MPIFQFDHEKVMLEYGLWIGNKNRLFDMGVERYYAMSYAIINLYFAI